MATASKKKESKVVHESRMLKTATYQRGRFSKRIKHPGPKLPSSWHLLQDSLAVINKNKRIFFGIFLIYAALSLLLVRGFSNTAGLGELKASLQLENSTSVDSGFTLLNSLFTANATNTGTAAAMYQAILVIIMSLVVIWVLRKIYATDEPTKISLKAAFYKSSYPLVPFLLIIGVMFLQLIPFMVGSSIYSTIIANGLAVSVLEQIAWAGLFFLLTVWSFYMLSSSLLAMYIVTLPNVAPLQALRSAKQLVRYRRWTVMRKVILLPIILSLIVAIIMLPIVIWLTVLAEWVLFVIGLLILFVVHSYLYRLYRELL